MSILQLLAVIWKSRKGGQWLRVDGCSTIKVGKASVRYAFSFAKWNVISYCLRQQHAEPGLTKLCYLVRLLSCSQRAQLSVSMGRASGGQVLHVQCPAYYGGRADPIVISRMTKLWEGEHVTRHVKKRREIGRAIKKFHCCSQLFAAENVWLLLT